MLEVYSEHRRRRLLVGVLTFDAKKRRYRFRYNLRYRLLRGAVPLGPEFDLSEKEIVSKNSELFPSLRDRIPSTANPAYAEYCRAAGISANEKNPLVLLGTIGRRGPSSFIFEMLSAGQPGDPVSLLKNLKNSLKLSSWDIAQAFDIPELSIQRILSGKCSDKNLLALLHVYLSFPEAGLWKLKTNQRKLFSATGQAIQSYLSQMRGPQK
jgi:hypothetical protein